MGDLRMRGFQSIPPVIKNLAIANALVFIAELTFGEPLINVLALHYYQSPEFGLWQFLTHMFTHGSIPHILFNMLALWMFGSTLEDIWGGKRFLTFYLLCGLGAAVVLLGAHTIELNMLMKKFNDGQMIAEEFEIRKEMIIESTAVGASGAINGVMVAFAWLFPNSLVYLYFAIPVKVKYVVGAYFLLDLFGGINPRTGDNVAHFAHVGGAIVGLILVITMNKNNRRTFY
ncbi:MAG TPA: rhomboid family intramembrane serine protease [Niastella sp.]